MYEYFSNDKCELILKLIKLYEKKYKNINPSKSDLFATELRPKLSSLQPTFPLPLIKSTTNKAKQKKILIVENDLIQKTTSSNSNVKRPLQRMASSIATLDAVIYANLYLQYKDNTVKWIYYYEIKKLLFYLKFLPKYKNLKIIRLFPLYLKVLFIYLLL